MADGPTIVAKFIADTSKMNDEVDKATSGVGGKFKDMAKTAGLAIGGAFAVDKIIDFGQQSVEAALADAEAQTVLAQTLKNVTGATDDQVAAAETFMSTLSKQTAIADDELRPALGNLVRGFGNAEDAQKALALATDISAGTGKDLGTVSVALQKAAMGQTGALKKLGVETENADGSAKSLDQIMGDLGKTFGGTATASADTAAGRLKNAQVQFGEFQEQVGSALIPVLASLGTTFTETIIPAFQSMANWIADNKDLLIAGFIGFAVVVGSVLVPAFIAWSISAAAAAIATLAAAAPFILIGALIAGVAFLIIKNWDNIKAGAEVVWNFILNAIQTVWNWISENWPLLLVILLGPIGAAVVLIQKNWDTIMNGIQVVWDVIQNIFGFIVALVTGAWDIIKNGATAVWQWITDKWNLIVASVRLAVDTLTGLVSGAWEDVKAGATAVWKFVTDKWQAIADAFHAIVDKIGATAQAIVAAIKGPINAVLAFWNNLAFRVPEFTLPSVDLPVVGKVGGQTLGGWTIEFPDIPTLARGGVLDRATLFVGGEAGREIVAPEDMLRTIIAEESGGGTYILNVYPRRADAADVAYGFRRLELMAGLP